MTRTLVEYARRPQRAAQADGLNDVIDGIGLLAITAMQFAGFRFQATIHGHNFAQTPAFRNAQMVFFLSIIGMFAVIFLSKRGGVSCGIDLFILGWAISHHQPEHRNRGDSLPLLPLWDSYC